MLGPVVTKVGTFNTNPTGLTSSTIYIYFKYVSDPPPTDYIPSATGEITRAKKQATQKRTKIKANKTKQNKTSEDNEQVPQISVSVHPPHRCHPVRVWGDKS